MKKKILLFTVVAGLGSLVISSYHGGPARNGYDCTGAEGAAMGSFVNPTGCSAGSGCHKTTATTSIGVAIELDSAGIAKHYYIGGQTYTVKITGTPTGTSNTNFGFQLNALKGIASASTNADAGTWSSTGLPTGTQRTVPGTYTQLTCMEHSNTQTLSGSSFTKTFTWTAPPAGTGPISFWGAVNFVNGNTGADAGDVWNTSHIIIGEGAYTLAVNNVQSMDIKAFPNPVINTLNLQFGAATPGNYKIHAFDMFGRTVANETIELTALSQFSINTSNWPSGLYQLVIENEGVRQVIPIVK